MPAKVNEREYRRILTEMEARAEEDGGLYVEGYATTYNQPYTLMRDGKYRLDEQVDPAAFSGTDMADVIMQYDHAGRVFARTKNGTLQLESDEHGLKVRARLDGTDIGRQLYQEIAGGYTDKMSFGFTVAEDRKERSKVDGVNVILRTITKIGKLFDVSAVSIPANDATEISARKISDGLIAEAAEEIRAEEEREAREAAEAERRRAALERLNNLIGGVRNE